MDAVGAGVSGFQAGERVAALTVYGGFAEFLVREAEHFIPIPDGVADRAASPAKHATARLLGAVPIDYRAGPIDHLIRALEPGGVDYAFDAVGGANIGPCIGALRRRGTLVGFGFMGAPGLLSQMAMFANIFACARLRGRRGKSYGITLLCRKDPRPLRRDLPKIFVLLAEKKIDPLLHRTFPLLEARQALELLASGSVVGKIVLVA